MKLKPLWKIKEDCRTLKRRWRVARLVLEGRPVLFGAYVELGTGMSVTHMNIIESTITLGGSGNTPSITGESR